MSQTKKTYKLGNIKQLIDLNGDSTNFKLSFKVTCHDDTPFDLLVVDQATLDNTSELQYKEVNNTISGNIVADKNIYQNYFLILRSKKPCSVDVEFTKNVLTNVPENVKPVVHKNINKNTETKQSFINWKKIGLILLIIVGGIYVLRWLYNNNNKQTILSSTPETETIPLTSPVIRMSNEFNKISRNTPNTSYKSSVSPNVMSKSSDASSDRSDDSLLYRLKKFAH
jgi:hypothetical protein